MFSPKKTAFIQEQYEREAKYFRIYDDYTPDYKKRMITAKFYSKYEVFNLDDVDLEVVDKIRKFQSDTPNQKYPWPETENQRYGWFTEPLIEVDVTDTRFYHPKKATDFIKHQLELQRDEENFPKTKFTGIPFKVQ